MKTADGREITKNGAYYAIQNGKTVILVKGREVGEILGDEEYWCNDVYYVRMNAVTSEIQKHEDIIKELNIQAMDHATKISILKQDDSLVRLKGTT